VSIAIDPVSSQAQPLTPTRKKATTSDVIDAMRRRRRLVYSEVMCQA